VFPGAKAVVLLRFWHPAVTGRTCPAPPFRSAGPRPGDSFPTTGLRTHRHRQHHGPGASGAAGTPWNPGSRAF